MKLFSSVLPYLLLVSFYSGQINDFGIEKIKTINRKSQNERPDPERLSKFNKVEFLNLFGIWNQKNADEINIFKDIFKDRKKFGRSDIELLSTVSIPTS